MTPKEEENYLKEQAEIICNSIAFWEKKIAEFETGGFSGRDEEELLYLDEEGESWQEPTKELAYLISHLQFDMREMEKLDKKCKAFMLKRKNNQ